MKQMDAKLTPTALQTSPASFEPLSLTQTHYQMKGKNEEKVTDFLEMWKNDKKTTAS